MSDLISEKAVSLPVPAKPQWTPRKERQIGEVEQVEMTKDSIKIKLKPDPREETNRILGKIADELHQLNWYAENGFLRG